MKGCRVKDCDFEGKGLTKMNDEEGGSVCSKHFAEDYNRRNPPDPAAREKRERTETIRKMQRASADFYRAACAAGCHAYIEFTGLMNEFIKVCQEAEEQGIDWTMANTHNDIALPLQPYHVGYLREKLDCIYGPSVAAIVDEMGAANGKLCPHSKWPPEECDVCMGRGIWAGISEAEARGDLDPAKVDAAMAAEFEAEDGIGDHTPIPPREKHRYSPGPDDDRACLVCNSTDPNDGRHA